MKRLHLATLLVVLLFGLLNGCAKAPTPEPTLPPPTPTPSPQPTPKETTLWDLLQSDPRFSQFAEMARSTGMDQMLQGDGPFTLLVPTNDALKKVPASRMQQLREDSDGLLNLVLNHVLTGRMTMQEIAGQASVYTGLNYPVTVSTQNGMLLVGKAAITDSGLTAANGTLLVADAALLPPQTIYETLRNDGRFKTLVKALDDTGLADALKARGSFTIFAPTDDAFAKLPASTLDVLKKDTARLKSVLQFHIVQGVLKQEDLGKLTGITTMMGKPLSLAMQDDVLLVNSAQVVQGDQLTTNGLIHVVDRVLFPPQNLYETIQTDPRLTTLLKAVDTAGLQETLKARGPFTLFAPSEEAFAALPPGELNRLLLNPAILRNTLLYHIINGRQLAADLTPLKSVTTQQGALITITVKDGKLYYADAEIIFTDIAAENGVIHIINKVILTPK